MGGDTGPTAPAVVYGRCMMHSAAEHQGMPRAGGKGQGLVRTRGDDIVQAAHVGGQPCAPSLEDGADLPEFSPSRAHLLLEGFYGDHLHHNVMAYLDGFILYNAMWKRSWRQLATQLDM